MRISVKPETSFGTITQFNTFDLELVKRNKFVQPSDVFDISKTTPKEYGTSNSSFSSVSLSPRFNDLSLMTFTLNPPVGSSRARHAYSNKVIYENLQRLCYEVLEPTVDYIGERPIINTGLLFVSSIKDLDEDSFYADQVKGNAVVFSFPDDPTNSKIADAFNFISEFSLYDRLIYNSKPTFHTVSVSVNNKKRRMKSITD